MLKKGKYHILLIEDNRLNCQLILDMLSVKGKGTFFLETAETLANGIGLLRKRGIDLILLDLNLPDSKGIETLSAVISLKKNIPIIVISALEDEEIALQALSKGASDYLLKGHIDSHIIIRSIRYAMERKRIEDELLKAYSQLEEKIDERTEELRKINQELATEITQRREIEHQLRESAEKYKGLFENSIEAVFTVDLKGNFTEINCTFEEISGSNRDEIIGQNYSKFVSSETAEKVFKAYNRLFLTGEPIKDLKYDFIRKNGQPKTVEGYVNCIRKADKVVGFQGTFRDVTERDLSLGALRESEQKFRDLFENSIEAVFTVDLKGTITSVNHALSEISGYTIEEHLGKNYRELMTHKDAKATYEAYNRLYRTGKPIKDMVSHMVNKTGELRTVQSYVNVIRKGNDIVGFQGTLRDITEKQRMEEALRISEEKYRQVIENAQESIVIIVDGVIEYANPVTEKLTGYTMEELKSKSLTELIHPDNHEELMNEYHRKLSGDPLIYPSEYKYITKDGETRWYDSVSIAISWEGKPAILIFARDITDRKNLERQLLQSQKMEAIGSMAGGIAHNFNNILVGIMGYSEYLLSKRNEDDPDYKALKTIFDSTMKASQLTRQLLNVTRSGEYKLERCEINDVVYKVLDLITGTFEKSIQIRTNLEMNLPSFNADPAHLEQCLLNLCINAGDAMPAGGALIIETYVKDLDNDFVRTHIGGQTGKHLVLTVSDTGIGMSQEVKDHIFEPFFTTKPEQAGTGMGLSTVYGTVKKHGGFISVYSELGEGTAFKIYFPVTRSRIKEDKIQDFTEEKRGHETILIIDDEQVVRDLWADYLRSIGYEVISAENGEEGVSLFLKRKDRVDLIILDVIMPKMGGKDALKRIKEIDPNAKILIASGYSENGKAGEFITDTVEGFIQKPTTLKELSEKIRGVLDSV